MKVRREAVCVRESATRGSAGVQGEGEGDWAVSKVFGPDIRAAHDFQTDDEWCMAWSRTAVGSWLLIGKGFTKTQVFPNLIGRMCATGEGEQPENVPRPPEKPTTGNARGDAEWGGGAVVLAVE